VSGAGTDVTVPSRAPWSGELPMGRTLQIIDLGGNQAVDCLMYARDDTDERYSAADTITAQRNIFVVPGTQLLSNEGRVMATVTESGCERHDTIGGACSRESNTLRYGHHTFHQHACVENFLDAGGLHGLTKRDLVSNLNWFMNVPVGDDGTLGIVDGISAPGLTVSFRAEMDLLVVISNCPQVNNPCNGFDPTPVRLVIS
jgi:uncharacterized protein